MTQEFETTLIAQDIVVRQVDGESEFIEKNAGFWFPLIRIKDTVFSQDKIGGFSYTVGAELLPKVSVTIEDFNKSFLEEEFPKVDDIITVRVSNNQDTVHKPIKLDFLIIDISSSPTSSSVTIEGVQYIPVLHEYKNIGWNDSLYNISKIIAEESGLGFVTNMSDSADTSNWICPNNYYEYLKYIEQNMFISSDDVCKIFIDQFNNLNVVSLKSAFNDRTSTKLLTVPFTGIPFSVDVDVKLSNKKYLGEEGEEEGSGDLHVQVNQWSPFSNYGVSFLRSKAIASYSQKNSEVHLNPPEIKPVNVQNINALENSEVKIFGTYVDSETVFKDILISKKQNKRLKEIYEQGTYVTADLEYYVPDIFSFMYIPAELYNKGRTSELNSQDANKDIDDVSLEDPKYKTHSLVLNEEFSGDYLVRSSQFMYIPTSNGEVSNITQRLVMVKL